MVRSGNPVLGPSWSVEPLDLGDLVLAYMTLGTTSDAVQALLPDHPAPADPVGGARRRRARYDISREQLRDLHHGQRVSFTEIGQRTGYSRTAINDLARAYGMPTRT